MNSADFDKAMDNATGCADDMLGAALQRIKTLESQSANIVIIRARYDDREYPQDGILGVVRTELSPDEIEELFDKYLEDVVEPDTDGLFIDWLIENHGCENFGAEIATIYP